MAAAIRRTPAPRWAATLLGLVLSLTPALAAACPACARKDAGLPLQLLSLSMMVLPFVVAGIVYKTIRPTASDEAEQDGENQP